MWVGAMGMGNNNGRHPVKDISRGGVYVTRTRDPLRDRQVF